MIKCEVVFDGDDIYIKGKMLQMIQGVNGDYWVLEDIGEMFKTIEQAIKYCMEN